MYPTSTCLIKIAGLVKVFWQIAQANAFFGTSMLVLSLFANYWLSKRGLLLPDQLSLCFVNKSLFCKQVFKHMDKA